MDTIHKHVQVPKKKEKGKSSFTAITSGDVTNLGHTGSKHMDMIATNHDVSNTIWGFGVPQNWMV